MNAERARIASFGRLENGLHQAWDWYIWGPYVTERQWGTVREDYSVERARPHPQGAALRADRAAGQSRGGRQGVLVVPRRGAEPRLEPLAVSLPAGCLPYDDLVRTNGARNRFQPEYELLDTGVFDGDRYWIAEVSYARAGPDDVLMTVRVKNAGELELLAGQGPDGTSPTLLFCENETNLAHLYQGPPTTAYPKDRLFDEGEFLSPYGLRALSAYHRDHPYVLDVEGQMSTIDYEPAESTTAMFGGNSNWRGPLWFPLNFLLTDVRGRYHRFCGDDLTLEYPSGSGHRVPLDVITADLQDRLISIFLVGPDGRRPCFGGVERLQQDPEWKDNIVFSEYFHGDNAAGLGASHQTGWTGVIADVLAAIDPGPHS